MALVAQEVMLEIQEHLVNQETQAIPAITVLVELAELVPMAAMLVAADKAVGLQQHNLQVNKQQEIMAQQEQMAILQVT